VFLRVVGRVDGRLSTVHPEPAVNVGPAVQALGHGDDAQLLTLSTASTTLWRHNLLRRRLCHTANVTLQQNPQQLRQSVSVLARAGKNLGF